MILKKEQRKLFMEVQRLYINTIYISGTCKKIPHALFSPPPHLIYIYDGPLDIRIPLTMFYKMCNPLLFILMFISTMLNNSKSVLTADCTLS